jgi:hypothetical protein
MNLVDATQRRVDVAVARRAIAQAQQACQALGAETNLRIVAADSSDAIVRELVAALGAIKQPEVSLQRLTFALRRRLMPAHISTKRQRVHRPENALAGASC